MFLFIYFQCSFNINISIFNIKNPVTPSKQKPYLLHLIILGQIIYMIENKIPFFEISLNQWFLFQKIKNDNHNDIKLGSNITKIENQTNLLFLKNELFETQNIEITENIFKENLDFLIKKARFPLQYINLYMNEVKMYVESYIQEKEIKQKLNSASKG